MTDPVHRLFTVMEREAPFPKAINLSEYDDMDASEETETIDPLSTPTLKFVDEVRLTDSPDRLKLQRT